jgi:error-prone DNA polymerase
MTSLPAYAELHCLSNFSFLRGASHAGELVARAVGLGYTALAVTDECSFAGSVRAHLAARGTALRLIHGTELQLACGMKLVLLAQNRAGYGNLSALVTLGRRRAEKGGYQLTRNDLAGWDGGGVPDCLALWIPPIAGVGAGEATGRSNKGRSPRRSGWRNGDSGRRCALAGRALHRPRLDRFRAPPAAR